MKNVSQRKLADMLQVQGLDIDKNAIQRMESGKRFITDIELKALAKVLNVTYAELLDSVSYTHLDVYKRQGRWHPTLF